jgi:hypothetical protein
MQTVNSHNGFNYINVSEDYLNRGDTLLWGNYCGQIETIEYDGIWVTATIVGHPYQTKVTNVKGEGTFHLVVKDQADWDARQRRREAAYESLNS